MLTAVWMVRTVLDDVGCGPNHLVSYYMRVSLLLVKSMFLVREWYYINVRKIMYFLSCKLTTQIGSYVLTVTLLSHGRTTVYYENRTMIIPGTYV